MKIAFISLLMVGSSLCQEWHNALSHQPTGQITGHPGALQMRPLWSPSSAVQQDPWSTHLLNGPDQRSTLEHLLGFTGPMVFPRGHEGMFHIPPAPHHLPRPVPGVHSLQHNIQRMSSSVPQVTEAVDEGNPRPIVHGWTGTTNVHSWTPPSHQSWSGWPHNSIPSVDDSSPQNFLTSTT